MSRYWVNLATGSGFLALLAALTVGCGGSGSTTSSSGTTPAAPSPGTYRGGYNRSTGTVIVHADASGNLSFGVDDPGSSQTFTGSTSLGTSDTFTATLTNNTANQVVVTGTTYAKSIAVSVSGAFSAPNVMASFVSSTNNTFAGNYSGTMTGGLSSINQTLTMTVNNNASQNVAGTSGALSLSGSMSSVGVFTASAPGGSLGGTLNFSGTFTIDSSGTMHGSGTWIDASNALNFGAWSVTNASAG